jgi:hypothetical protein
LLVHTFTTIAFDNEDGEDSDESDSLPASRASKKSKIKNVINKFLHHCDPLPKLILYQQFTPLFIRPIPKFQNVGKEIATRVKLAGFGDTAAEEIKNILEYNAKSSCMVSST